MDFPGIGDQLVEFDKNDSNVTFTRDDDKNVLIHASQILFLKYMVLKSFKKHPMLLLLMITMHIKLFYVSQILFQKSTALKSLIKVIPMLLLHVMMMLTKLFSVSQILYEKELAFEKR